MWAILLMRTCKQSAVHRHDMSVMLAQFNVRVPLTTPSQVRGSSRDGGQQRGFGEYVLSYIDGDMLIGSASQGTFIFERASE